METKRNIKILDFDCEARPLSYWYDRPTAEITAIASCWVDDPKSMLVHLLGEHDTLFILNSFVERYNEADMVTGHYIRRFDLPLINGALMEFGLPKLKPKLTSDTKMDMYSKGDIPATQEFLGELFGLDEPKIQMSQVKWRAANRLSREGLRSTKKRVVGDVTQHMALRKWMLEHDLLKSPRMWFP